MSFSIRPKAQPASPARPPSSGSTIRAVTPSPDLFEALQNYNLFTSTPRRETNVTQEELLPVDAHIVEELRAFEASEGNSLIAPRAYQRPPFTRDTSSIYSQSTNNTPLRRSGRASPPKRPLSASPHKKSSLGPTLEEKESHTSLRQFPAPPGMPIWFPDAYSDSETDVSGLIREEELMKGAKKSRKAVTMDRAGTPTPMTVSQRRSQFIDLGEQEQERILNEVVDIQDMVRTAGPTQPECEKSEESKSEVDRYGEEQMKRSCVVNRAIPQGIQKDSRQTARPTASSYKQEKDGVERFRGLRVTSNHPDQMDFQFPFADSETLPAGTAELNVQAQEGNEAQAQAKARRQSKRLSIFGKRNEADAKGKEEAVQQEAIQQEAPRTPVNQVPMFSDAIELQNVHKKEDKKQKAAAKEEREEKGGCGCGCVVM